MVVLNKGNQLQSVADAIATQTEEEGFKEEAENTTDYAYDENGNAKTDLNKGVTAIAYNFLNLPSLVTKSVSEYVTYDYDATGRKLSQEVYSASHALEKKSDYLGEFFYENDELKFINHEEGRIIPQDGNMEYQYHMKDYGDNESRANTADHTINRACQCNQ